MELITAVVKRKVTHGYRAIWAATGKANIRAIVNTAHHTGAGSFANKLAPVGA